MKIGLFCYLLLLKNEGPYCFHSLFYRTATYYYRNNFVVPELCKNVTKKQKSTDIGLTPVLKLSLALSAQHCQYIQQNMKGEKYSYYI